MRSFSVVSLLALCTMLGMNPQTTGVQALSTPQAVHYTFDKARAGGVTGSINVVYDSPLSPNVSITTDIDMRALNMTQVLAVYPGCAPHIQEYKWYLVVNDVGVVPLVGFLDVCDLIDPSDVWTPEDTSSTPRCNATTSRNVNLSGQLGRLIVQNNGRISQSWTNVPFPSYAQVTPRWSMVLHAVCGDSSPPVVCARVDFELRATNSHHQVHRKEAHGIVGVAAFVLASSLLLFLS